jgi:DNA-binding NtrC family response regulator/tetratricopeptide (TPR) repeat protein
MVMKQEAVCQLFDKIEELIQDRHYKDAISELEKIKLPDLDSSEAGQYYLLLSSAEFGLGIYDENKIDKAIDLLKNTNANDAFAESKFLKAQLKIAQGDFIACKEYLAESYAGYLRSGNERGAAAVLNRIAYVNFFGGNIDSAIDALNRCINIHSKLGSEDKVIACKNNLATILFVSGNLNAAIKNYDEIKESIKKLNDEYCCAFTLTYGMAKALKGDRAAALEIFKDGNFPVAERQRQNAQYYEYLGWVQILNDNYKEAEKTLLTGLELSLKIAPESALISQTKRLLADAYIGLGKFDSAQTYAAEALVVAEKINERAEIAGCWRVFAQTALHRGEKEEAREWYGKAIDLLAMISSRYELAVTRLLAATSGLYQNGERSALLYMAKEYFEAEQIAPYIEKVKQAMVPFEPSGAVERKTDGAPVFIGESAASRKIREAAEHVACSEMTVLLTGPTGTGKDQLARYIHWLSGRKGKFVTMNAAAVPDTMAEAELFGYGKGAFTGADKCKPGLLEEAEEGTFYLNEIAESTLAFQAKLLEILDTRMIRRLGENNSKKIKVRIIAATNRDLGKEIREGRFRSDLYHRLNEIGIALPSLTERLEDIPDLVRHFLGQLGHSFDGQREAAMISEFCELLATRDWPGNVRELGNWIKHTYRVSDGEICRMAEILNMETLSEYEKLLMVLEQTGWNQSETARRLNITEAGVRYKIKKFGIARSLET